MNESPEATLIKNIHDIIVKHPGANIDTIAELLQKKPSEIQERLRILEKHNMIISTKESGENRYYINSFSTNIADDNKEDTRRRIYNLIAERPGLYLAKIAETLGMSIQLAEYHLVQMQRDRLITAVKKLGRQHKRYYLAESGISTQERKILELLAKNTSLDIILLLLNHQTMQHKNLNTKLKISPSRLSYYLTQLVDNGILVVNPYGDEKGYELKNKEEILRIIKKYKLKIVYDSTVEEFFDIWRSVKYDEKSSTDS
jgi:predicted transcriptional regulator